MSNVAAQYCEKSCGRKTLSVSILNTEEGKKGIDLNEIQNHTKVPRA